MAHPDIIPISFRRKALRKSSMRLLLVPFRTIKVWILTTIQSMIHPEFRREVMLGVSAIAWTSWSFGLWPPEPMAFTTTVTPSRATSRLARSFSLIMAVVVPRTSRSARRDSSMIFENRELNWAE